MEIAARGVEDDRHLTQTFKLVGWHDDSDIGKLRGEKRERRAAHLFFGASGQETFVDPHPKPFDTPFRPRRRLVGRCSAGAGRIDEGDKAQGEEEGTHERSVPGRPATQIKAS